MSNNKPIGIFDSGVGGLTVLKKLAEILPNENYVYLGDTARIPYGEKSKEQIIQYSKEILDWYKRMDAKAVLVACNTSSAIALGELRDHYDFPILGLIEPAAEYVSKLDVNKIGVMATSATVKSGAYKKAIVKKSSAKEVFQVGCTGLVEIVESGEFEAPDSIKLIKKYVDLLMKDGVEKIILGCTHYPFLKEIIEDLIGRDDVLIDPAQFLAEQTYKTLEEKSLLTTSEKGSRLYFVSSNPEKFVSAGKLFFADCAFAEVVVIASIKETEYLL